MVGQIPLSGNAIAEYVAGDTDDSTMQVRPDVAYRRLAIVNVAFVGEPAGEWVLIDAGIFGTKTLIEAVRDCRFRGNLRSLPADGSVPHMPGWRWLHTPGHTPGHISLWRESDRTLIAGDAFITTRQESVYAVLTEEPELHGPPMYYTPDWDNARESVRRLAELQPDLVVTGHGRAMQGAEMQQALQRLAKDFDQIARPRD